MSKVTEITINQFAVKLGIQRTFLANITKSGTEFPAPVGSVKYGNREMPTYSEKELTKWYLAYKASKAITYNLKGKTSVKMPEGIITMRGAAEKMGVSEIALGVLKSRYAENFPKPLPEKIKNPYGGNNVLAYNLADFEAWVEAVSTERKNKRQVKTLLPNEWDLVEKAVKSLDTEQAKLLLEKIKQVRTI